MFRRSLSLAGFVALMALPVTARSTESSVSAARVPATSAPGASAPAASGQHEPLVFLPGAASVVDVDAIKAEIKRHRGHPVFLHLWASWCAPCLTELPMVNQWAERLRASGADLLSVSLDNPDQRAEHVLAVLHEKAPALTAAIARIDDPDRFIAAFHGVRGPQWEGSIPALFAFDKKGTLIRQLFGEASESDLAELARGAGVKAGTKLGTKPGRHAGMKRDMKDARSAQRSD